MYVYVLQKLPSNFSNPQMVEEVKRSRRKKRKNLSSLDGLQAGTFHDHGLQVRSISLQPREGIRVHHHSAFHSIAQSKNPFASITSETLEERKNHILMKHDSAKNADNLDETENFKHELASSLEEFRPTIEDTVQNWCLSTTPPLNCHMA